MRYSVPTGFLSEVRATGVTRMRISALRLSNIHSECVEYQSMDCKSMGGEPCRLAVPLK
jgi:hypothetical protein